MTSTDFDALDAAMTRDANTLGFVEAFKSHLHELAAVHGSDEVPHTGLHEDLLRWMREDGELAAELDNLPARAREELHHYVTRRSVATRTVSGRHDDFVKSLRHVLREGTSNLEGVLERDGTPVKCVSQTEFENWGRTVKNTPWVTCIPQTKAGVQSLVRWAREQGKTVRVSGYRHTWSDMYSADNEVLISLLPLEVVQDLPASEPPMDPDDELQGIKLVGEIQEDGATKQLCRIGAATTNEQFRRWCLDLNGGNWGWTIPLNVIMVEITFGGSNAPICHGAGSRNQTLSDLVAAIEFVNVKGELQVVDDPEQLKAASGCFGLLGVVTAVTLKLDVMSYARMQPSKPRLALGVPPPAGVEVPSWVDMTGITDAELETASETFRSSCASDYYAEWFWFPYQQHCWVNTWQNDGARADAQPYPGPFWAKVEAAAEYLAQLANSTVFRVLPGRWQAEVLAAGAIAAMPSDATYVAPLIDALHFRRGIQNMRVLDMEFEIPIPMAEDGQPDWSLCQRAWWDAIALVLESDGAPMRVALEMRVTADSNVTMAPQFGNRWGTCSIEVLTTPETDPGEWSRFMQQVADAWASYTDADGEPLNVRPHWAKIWQGLTFRTDARGHPMPIADYLRDVAYRDRIPEFKAELEAVATAGGFKLGEVRQVFSNGLLNTLFRDVLS